MPSGMGSYETCSNRRRNTGSGGGNVETTDVFGSLFSGCRRTSATGGRTGATGSTTSGTGRTDCNDGRPSRPQCSAPVEKFPWVPEIDGKSIIICRN